MAESNKRLPLCLKPDREKSFAEKALNMLSDMNQNESGQMAIKLPRGIVVIEWRSVTDDDVIVGGELAEPGK